MAKLRKKMKGLSASSKKTEKSDAHKALDDKLRQFDQMELARKMAEEARKYLQNRLLAEMELSKRNQRKIDEQWRKIMRLAKVEALRKELEILSQSHERNIDRKDAIIQMLDRDLEEADEQYLVALRRHLQNMDRLIELQDSRLLALETQFQKELHELESEFAAEKKQIEDGHLKDKKELEDVMLTVEEEEKERENEERQDHDQAREELRNKNLEELNVLRITLESQIMELEKHFEAAHLNYLQNTDQITADFKKLTKKDQELTREITIKIRKINRLQDSIAHWRTKIKSNIRECEERNKAVKAEKDSVTKHYQELKNRMNQFRDIQNGRLIELTRTAHATNKVLEDAKQQGIRLLKYAEMSRKYETEREKVLPFYTSSVEDEAVAEEASNEMMKAVQNASKQYEQKEEEVKEYHSKFIDNGKEIEEWNSLDHFYKKFNKVMVDKLAIERERDRLKAENSELQDLLKRYLDGIAVNDEVLTSYNPLLVINGKTNVQMPPVRERGNPTIQEGNTVVINNRLV